MVLKASVQGLEIVDKARKKKGWTKTVTVAWWQDALTTQATLRRFWRGIPIQSESFMNICHAVGISNWQDIVDKITDEEGESLEISYQEDWGEAPQLSTFYGRTEELTQLQEWIVNDRCRLVAFLGMGGIGKTALSVMLADKIQHDFDYLIWRSLRYSTSAKDLLTQIVQFLSNRKIEDLPTEFNSAVSLLIEYLKSYRCLVIFDGAEAIISQGETSEFYKEGYENWGELIKRLGQQRHKSTVIFTSREQFSEIAFLEEETPQVRSLLVSNLDKAAAFEIFKSKGLLDESHWERLLQIYRGNPLFLKLISGYIKNSFSGKVSDFLKLETIFIGDIQPILDASWQRLSILQKKVMFQLATNPGTLETIKLNQSVSTSEILESLQALQRRSLIERQLEGDEVIYGLQPIVKKYVVKQLN